MSGPQRFDKKTGRRETNHTIPHLDSHHETDDHGEGGGHGEPWLVSYADMMTLLFGFFVLMYSFESAKKSNVQDVDADMINITKELARYFGSNYISPLNKVAEDFQKAIDKVGLGHEVSMSETSSGIKIQFKSTVLFRAGDTVPTKTAKNLLESLANLILIKGDHFKIRVEGYTDDTPPKADSLYKSNWEISSSRAAAVVSVFEEMGHKPDRLMAVGYGATNPAFPNVDPEGNGIPQNRALNRRVVIYVIDSTQGIPANTK